MLNLLLKELLLGQSWELISQGHVVEAVDVAFVPLYHLMWILNSCKLQLLLLILEILLLNHLQLLSLLELIIFDYLVRFLVQVCENLIVLLE